MEVILLMSDMALCAKDMMLLLHLFVFLDNLVLECVEHGVVIFLVVDLSSERFRSASLSLPAFFCSPTCANVGSVVHILDSTT